MTAQMSTSALVFAEWGRAEVSNKNWECLFGVSVSASSKSNSLSVLPRRSVLHSHSACWEIKTHWSSSSSGGGGTDILTAVSMHRNTEELQYILHFKEIFLTTCVRCLPSSVTVAVAVCARHLQPSASRFLRSSKEFRDLLGITK